jgi:hypothetical protein
MTIPATETPAPATETTAAAPAPASASVETRNDPKALDAKNRELLGINKRLQEQVKEAAAKAAEAEALRTKIAKIGEAYGFDAATESPEARIAAEAARRAAEEESARARASKLRDEVMVSLLGLGRKLDPEAVRAIIAGASGSALVTITEGGAVEGVPAYLEAVLGSLGGDATAPVPPRLPRSAGAQSEDVEPKFSGVKSWQGLVKMGLEAKEEFMKKYPVRYARMQADFDSRFTPRIS